MKPWLHLSENCAKLSKLVSPVSALWTIKQLLATDVLHLRWNSSVRIQSFQQNDKNIFQMMFSSYDYIHPILYDNILYSYSTRSASNVKTVWLSLHIVTSYCCNWSSLLIISNALLSRTPLLSLWWSVNHHPHDCDYHKDYDYDNVIIRFMIKMRPLILLSRTRTMWLLWLRSW